MRLKIGLDIDDTVGYFMQPYLNIFGIPKYDHEITRNVQKKLKYNKEFWENLPVKNIPDFEVTLYCTKRVNPKTYTKNWLKKNGLPNAPIYQMYYQGGNKATMIKGRVDVFIDDSISNWKMLNDSGVPCLLMDSKENQHIETPLRIYSLNYSEIKRIYNNEFGTN